MKHLSNIESRQEAGFTLVELAVVMVIIGLLIGGILKGQELIANAQVTATIAQIKGIDAALTTFKDKYGQLPGDMRTPGTRLNGCAGACAGAGNGNGRIGGNNSVTVAIGGENQRAWYHLAAAGLIQGVQVNGNNTYGEGVPSSKAGSGGFRIGYDQDGNGIAGINGFRPGHYLALSSTLPTGVVANDANGAVPGSQAAQIDRKLDDALPNTGSVRSQGTGCRNAANYDERDRGLCNVIIQVQG